jgi:hypothetical protein
MLYFETPLRFQTRSMSQANEPDLELMHLLIISHTEHYEVDGQCRGWGATVREIDHLASLFESVTHLAWRIDGPAPRSALPYRAGNVTLRLVSGSGGQGLRSKAVAAGRVPGYLKAVAQELPRADVVHVRCPASISMAALVWLAAARRPSTRWFKYAGSWKGYPSEPWSYRLQRWWLCRNISRGVVTVNGEWPCQPEHVVGFLNPCLEEAEIEAGRKAAYEKRLVAPVRLLFVGRVDDEKGADRVVGIANALVERGKDVRLDVVGDGPERPKIEKMADGSPAGEVTTFHGWLPRPDIGDLYSKAHFVILPSTCSEGWPKVLAEGFAYGCVPIASNVGSIPAEFARLGVGCAHAADDVAVFAQTIVAFLAEPQRWIEASERAVEVAPIFGYAKYLDSVKALLVVKDVRS